VNQIKSKKAPRDDANTARWL